MPHALRARYVFPVDRPPMAGGTVTVDGDRIVAVGGNSDDPPPRDLGNVAILPGLVNAHAHLEFSELTAPLGRPGMPLPDWIREVLAWRRSSAGSHADALALGLAECLRTGTTTVADVATPEFAAVRPEDESTQRIVMLELIALRRDRIDSMDRLAADHLQRHAQSAGAGLACLSPHAPYSVHLELLGRVCDRAAEDGLVAMHLAESPEEIDLLATGGGPLVRLLEELDAWEPAAIAAPVRPLAYLQTLSRASRALVIHGNYLDREEIAFLGHCTPRMSVVHCPRTHAYFRHDDYPLAEMLAAGVNVALGTDSRASSPDLNLLADVRLAARCHPQVAPADVLSMGTLRGAVALGIDRHVGTLTPGKRADLAIVTLPEHDAADPHDLLLGADLPAVVLRHLGC